MTKPDVTVKQVGDGAWSARATLPCGVSVEAHGTTEAVATFKLTIDLLALAEQAEAAADQMDDVPMSDWETQGP